MVAAAKAKAQATAQALMAQQQQQQGAPPSAAPAQAPASVPAGAPGTAGLSSAEMIRQRAEAVKARLQSLSASKAASAATGATGATGTTSAPASTLASTPAPAVDPRARGGLGVDLSSMISRDEHGNLVINAVTSGKTVKAPSFATAKVSNVLLLRVIDTINEEN